MLARAPFPLAVLTLLHAGCSSEDGSRAPPLDAGRTGASIAVLASGEIAVVDADHGSVSMLDPTTLEATGSIDVGGEPHALVELPSGALLVATYRGGEMVRIDVAAREVVERRAVCAGAYGLAMSPSGDAVYVSCEWEGTVVRVDPETLQATTLASGLRRPRAIVAVSDSVVALDFVGGGVHRIDADGVASSSLVPLEAPYRPALTTMTANLAAAVVPAFGRLYVAHELVNHTGDSTVENLADDYGSVVDGNPRINPAVTALSPDAAQRPNAGDPPALFARYDGSSRAFNAPWALAPFGDRHVLVANLSSNDVAVLDAAAGGPEERVVGSFAVGAGPSGVAVDRAGRYAFVDNAFDGSVSRIDLHRPFDVSAPRYAADATRVRLLPQRYSNAALAGRKLFHDATNRHVTPSSVVACSTCHPGGGDDGLVWFAHTSAIPLKRRRTPHLGNAHTATAPFHWDGGLADMPTLVQDTITGLMAGDGLLVDGAAVQAYLDEMVQAPLLPIGDAAAVERGREAFVAASCATCHAGAQLTDNANHVVLDPMTLQADDAFGAANTPGLRGLFLRAPYFHDGRSPSLEDLLSRGDAAGHGDTARLSAGEQSDLLAYLRSL